MNIIEGMGISIPTYLLPHMNHRVILLVAALLISLGTAFAITIASPVLFMWVYCLSIGIASSLAYLPPLICAWEAHPENKGLITGAVMGAYSFGSLLLNFLFMQMANPEELNPSQIVYKDGSVSSENFFPLSVSEQIPQTVYNVSMI